MSLTIIGLGWSGTSLGLALKSAIPEMVITGHDPEPERTAQARKLGAIDKSQWNLPAACEQADLVLVDLPTSQLELTLKVLAESLPENALIIDFSPSKRASLAYASRLLPTSLQFLGGHVVPSVTTRIGAEPSAAMLQDATFFLAASTETSERAINTAAGLAEALGSQPYFVAPDELDSLIAAGSQMPFMAAMSMMSAWQHTSGWQDRQHALGASTRWITDMLTDSSEDQESGLWENRDYIDEWLERVISAMQTWRERLQSQDSSSLDAAITSVRQNAWAREPEDQTTTIDNGELAGFRQLFMGSLGRRGKGKR